MKSIFTRGAIHFVLWNQRRVEEAEILFMISNLAHP